MLHFNLDHNQTIACIEYMEYFYLFVFLDQMCVRPGMFEMNQYLESHTTNSQPVRDVTRLTQLIDASLSR